ncbi:MAG: bifunctional N-acetylglucosamine-1-phosphate uridyltransferase/glucosamine-1-phosphate acetyltransferase [Phycisphaerae bacterium]
MGTKENMPPAGSCSAEPAPGSPRGLTAIILAAGKSTRMKTDLPKVMHDLCGQPMLSYVLSACRAAGIDTFHLVVGFGKDRLVRAYGDEPGLQFVEQREQKGTGHAVSMCTEALRAFDGDVVVIAGDMPMVRPETLRTLVHSHRAAGAAASLATTVLDDPAGYGRILRDAAGRFDRIVEDRDCTPEQKAIREVNPSYYCFDARSLFAAIPKLKPDNAKGEFYITDVLEILRAEGRPVRAATSVPAEDAVGINSRADLAAVAKVMQRRIQAHWMEAGVTIVDPGTTWIDVLARIGPESVIKPFSYIEGNARVGRRCVVGPYACLRRGAVIEDDASVGPGVFDALDSGSPARSAGAAAKPKRPTSVVRHPPAQGDPVRGGRSC